jgi:ubiquitin-activating enzyme E1
MPSNYLPLRFEDYFSNRVKQLTFTFPEDAATSMGAHFWCAPKRFPHPLEFSAADSSHIQFIMSASILRALSFGISIPDWAKDTNNLADAAVKLQYDWINPFHPTNQTKNKEREDNELAYSSNQTLYM